MGVPSSGQLRLRADINEEINGNDTDTNVSLGTLSNDAGFTEPDKMSDFYGYVDATAPTLQWYFYSVSSGPSPDGSVSFRWYFTGDGGSQVTDFGVYVGTNSSGPTANTKYQGGTGTPNTFNYPTVTGLSNNTTYYVWAYATNAVGTTFTTNLSQPQSFTVPAPYIPVTNTSYYFNGDFTSANYCPNNNFVGQGCLSWYNNTTSTTIAVYGDSNFQYLSSGSYPNCYNTAGVYQAENEQRNRCVSMRSTCRDNSTCGNTRTFYSKWFTSGYTDKINSQSRACPGC